ncbi:MAG TPA: xanthine dehydrogenase subunit D [Candidatus Dormibacteraeota bacterium]
MNGGVGESARRPDGPSKVRGEFVYSSDLWAPGMLWGVTVRSPHPHARVRRIDAARARALPGVHAVLTHDDVPGDRVFGLEVADQPVLAWDVVRCQGEAVALVAAEHPETARRAAALVDVDYDVLEPVTDPERALAAGAPAIHPGGNVTRHVRIRRGDRASAADVVVRGEYEVGMQDQAPLGPESGLAVPAADGGVDLAVATQWLHADQRQVAGCLGLPPERVRLTLAGVGGAFGAREDVSMQVHACLLALRTGRPVKMVYTREESFVGHVHRHPARLAYEHGATADGRLVFVRARIVLDGGPYTSSSPAVAANAACFAVGPYRCPNATIDAIVAFTNNPTCGAMRGFGAVQTCFAYEAQMDRLAARLGLHPLELRARNAMAEGDAALPTGQEVVGPVPVTELLRRLRALPLPAEEARRRDPRRLPGGVANTTHGEGVRRGVGYAAGIKNIGFSEGFDDFSTARVRLHVADGRPAVEVRTAAAEVGQGLVTVCAQVAVTELGVAEVTVRDADTSVGSAGSSSASRQTYCTGGAVRDACRAVRDHVLGLAVEHLGLAVDPAALALRDGAVVTAAGDRVASLADVLAEAAVEETRVFRHPATAPLDAETGQGRPHAQHAFAAHRAVVDVDVELGLVRVVELATAQDVGRAINPLAVEGQLEGGSAQGLGLALMEEVQVRDGVVRNASFTDYLIPTMLDMPPVRTDVLELGDPDAPYGLKGVGEPPTISSTPAIVAALRAATGAPLTRVPVRPQDIAMRSG